MNSPILYKENSADRLTIQVSFTLVLGHIQVAHKIIVQMAERIDVTPESCREFYKWLYCLDGSVASLEEHVCKAAKEAVV